MSVVSAPAGPTAPIAEPQRQRYLHGVQGLRTVAALMVAVYHIWFNRVSGGVDVFFVVAGFFAAGSLLKVSSRTSRVGRASAAGQYLLRTARRVIPSAAVVIIGTVAAGIIFLPRSLWESSFPHGRASLLFYENWYLIEAGHDYLQQGMAASPFQQFWALGIQVQSYVLFVFVALAAAAAARFLRGSVKRTLLIVSLLLLAASLWWSVSLTATAQPVAYFDLGTRFWEFLIGVLLALLISGRQFPKLPMKVIGWLGMGTMLGFAALFDPSAALPGFLALVPVLAGAAIISAAQSDVEPGILRWRPLTWFADSSFAFYLWHWPVLVYYKWQFDSDVGVLAGTIIIALSALLAVATTKLVEQPVRSWGLLHRRPLVSIVVCAALFLPPAGALAGWQWLDAAQTEDDWANVTAVLDGAVVPDGELVPSTAIARLDRASGYSNGCHVPPQPTDAVICESGDLESDLTVAVAGGSHEAQWVDSIGQFGETHGFRVVSMTKSGCPFGDVADSDLNPSPSCLQWQDNMQAKLLTIQPDLLVVMATRFVDGVEEVPAWKVSAMQRLTDAGIPVLGVRDNAFFDHRVPECVDQKGTEACGFSRKGSYLPLEDLAIPSMPGFSFVDMADAYCAATFCPVVQDGVLMFYDDSHLTRTWTVIYGGNLHSAIAEQLEATNGQ